MKKTTKAKKKSKKTAKAKKKKSLFGGIKMLETKDFLTEVYSCPWTLLSLYYGSTCAFGLTVV